MLWAWFSFISFGNFDLWVVQIVFPNFVGPERHQVSDHDELVVCPVRLRQVFDLGVVAAQLAVHRGAVVAQKNPAVHFFGSQHTGVALTRGGFGVEFFRDPKSNFPNNVFF